MNDIFIRHGTRVHFAILGIFSFAVTVVMVQAMQGLAAEIDGIKQTSVVVPDDAPAIREQASAAPDTSGWKTYRNEEYGFEVGYPSEWAAIESNAPGMPYVAFITFGKKEYIQSGGVLAVAVRQQTFDEYIEILKREGVVFIQENKVNLGGLAAVRGHIGDKSYKDQETVLLTKDNYLYEITVSPASLYRDIFNQVIAAFVFVK